MNIFYITIHGNDQEGRPTSFKCIALGVTEQFALNAVLKTLPNLKVSRMVWKKGSKPRVDIIGKWGYDYNETFPTDIVCIKEGVYNL